MPTKLSGMISQQSSALLRSHILEYIENTQGNASSSALVTQNGNSQIGNCTLDLDFQLFNKTHGPKPIQPVVPISGAKFSITKSNEDTTSIQMERPTKGP